MTIDLKANDNFNVKRTLTSTSCTISHGIMTTIYERVFEVEFTKKGKYIFNQESFIGISEPLEINGVKIKIKQKEN